MSDQYQILLQTKLHRPRPPKDLLTRTRLVNFLSDEINRQLILVCAPAGFGKSTLVSNWIRHMSADQNTTEISLPSAWLSLDENDNELNLFLHYFIAALRTIFSQACEHTLALLQARQQPPLPVLYTTFSNDLAKLPGELILVLDDYHTIHSADVHNLLSELARHWPSPLHLVLISRLSPPIPLSTLRAKGMLSEVRTRDLRFTPQEAATYLSQSQEAPLSQYALPLLEERFEGWPAGLHLAALSLRSAGSQEEVLSVLSNENVNITGYLADEVLTHQLPAIHAFLLKTSILDRFCAPLCEAVIGQIDAAWNARACLDWIESSELFLIPLDNRGEWYRYHHMFQELLQKRLSAELGPDMVSNLHRTASAWFDKQGLLDEALHHALAVGDLDLAASQMIAGLRDVVNREDRQTLDRWMHLLPEEMIQRSPWLLMIKVWSLQYQWRLDMQSQVLGQVEALLDSETSASLQENDQQLLHGQILGLRAQQAYFSNQTTRAINICRQALALLPASWTFTRGGTVVYFVMSMLANGQEQEAERLLLDDYASNTNKNDIYGLFTLQSLGFIYLLSGRLEQCRQIAQVLVQGATLGMRYIQKYWGHWFLGVVHYHRNELDESAQHFTQIFENRYIAQLSTYRDAVVGLVLIHQIRGEGTEAWQMAEALSQFDLEQIGSEDNRTRSLRARLMLLQGNLEGAGRWAESFTDLPPDQALLWLEEPQLTRARILVTRGTAVNLRLALQILDVLDEIAHRTHNTIFTVEILVLRVLALDAQGETRQAYSELKQAVDLARLGGFIRPFVDLGRPMQKILRRLAEQDPSAETVYRILAEFPQEETGQVVSDSPAQATHHPSPDIPTLVDPLTPRELEVLNLLRGPSSIKEIALKLNISYATAKRHTINLYSKLGVNQRWGAVARAEELNILPPG